MSTNFQLPTWTDTLGDNDVSDRAKLITKALSKMQAQMKAMKKEVITAEASKWMTHGQTAKRSH